VRTVFWCGLVSNEGQESNLAGLLYRFCYHTLMFCTGSGSTTGQNFTSVSDELIPVFLHNRLFVVNLLDFVYTEDTGFAS